MPDTEPVKVEIKKVYKILHEISKDNTPGD